MVASRQLKTSESAGRGGLVTIANCFTLARGNLPNGGGDGSGVSPLALIALDGADAENAPSSGLYQANFFPGPVVAIGPIPFDCTGTTAITDETFCRFTSTGRILTMPGNPWDGQRVPVVDADGTASSANFTQVGANTGQTIQDPYNRNRLVAPASRVSLSIPYQCVEWAWDQTNGVWRVYSDSAAGELPSATTTTGTTAILGKLWMKCSPAGAITLDLPSNPTEGLPIRVSDVSGGAAVHNITINPAATWSIEVLTLGGPGGSATIATDYQSATWAADVPNKVWRLTAINGPHA